MSSCSGSKRIVLVSCIAGLLQLFFSSDGWKRMALTIPIMGPSVVARSASVGGGAACVGPTMWGQLALLAIMFVATAFFVWLNSAHDSQLWTAVFASAIFFAINNPTSAGAMQKMASDMLYRSSPGGSDCLNITWMGSAVFAALFGAVLWLILEVSTSCS